MAWKRVYKGFIVVEAEGKWERVRVTNSVGFLIVDPIREVALLISQSRDAMIRRRNPSGNIVEIPAGRRDCSLTIKKLAAMEAFQEVGKRIKPEQVKLLNRGVPLALSPGVLTERMYLAYVEMDLRSCMKKGPSRIFGLKAHGERIRRRVVTFDELEHMTFADMKTFAIVQWFLKEQQMKKERRNGHADHRIAA